MSTGTNKERITTNNGIINENNSDLTALKTRINNLPTSGDTTATADDIALGKTAVSKGVRLTGSVPIGSSSVTTNYSASQVDTSQNNLRFNTSQSTNNQFFYQGDKISVLAPLSDVAPVVGAEANKIKKNEVICGVTGTYEGGSVEAKEKDVNFYDYDGFRVYSYTKSEFLALQSMPDNPTHEGLTAQGWNWSLADAQDFVTANGELDVGQIYVTNDGKTRLYITLLEERKSLYLRFAINGTATIDWGDNSATEQVTGSDITVPFNTLHEYATGGNYVISIDSEEPIYFVEESNKCKVLNGNGLGDNYYRNSLTKVEIGTNMTKLCLSQCLGLKYITIPNNVTVAQHYTFYNCRSLENVNIPVNMQTSNSEGSPQPFYMCTGIKHINLANNYFSDSEHAYANCSNLKRIIIPKLTAFAYNMFANCGVLKEIIVPDLQSVNIQVMTSSDNGLVKIIMGKVNFITNSYAFRYCKEMKWYDFTKCISVPQLVASAFDNIPVDCKIVVPDALYEDWISSWSVFANYIVKASEA